MQGIPDDGPCNRKQATADGCLTVKIEWTARVQNTMTEDDDDLALPGQLDSSMPANDIPSVQVWKSTIPEDAANMYHDGIGHVKVR